MGSPCMKNTPACKLKAEVGHVADSAKAAEFARREGSAAFEATRAATVERVIAGREAGGGARPVAAARRRARGRGGDAPGLPHAMELMFAAVDAQRHTWAAQREAYLAVAASARRRREFKATGDDYGAAARAPEARVLQRVADVLRDAAAAGAAAERRARDAEPHGGQGGRGRGGARGRGGGRGLRGAALRRAGRGVGGGRPGREPRGAGGRAPRYGACRAADPPSDKRRRLQDNVFSASEFLDYDRGGFVAATFDASVFALPGARLLEHWDLRHVGVFNPSVVALPAALRDTLRRSVYPDAYYVATVRHSWEQCFRFDIGHAKWATVGPDRSDAERPGRHTSVVLLDRDLCALGLAAQRFPDPWDARRGDVGWLAEDVRLFAHNAQSPLDSRLIATAVVVHDKSFSDYDQEHFNQSFGVFELVLDVDAKRRPTARYIPLPGEYYGAAARGHAAVTEVRNVGVFDGGDDLDFLLFLGAEAQVSKRLFPIPTRPAVTPLTGYFGKWLHNNVNPLLLKRHGLLLAVGHEHSNERNDEVHRTTSWHTYLHYFLLYNASAPHALLARSPPFCFASLDDPARCDLIQFVSSLSFARPNDDDRRGRGHDLLLGYGINDCRGALVRLPLRAVLDFTASCGLDPTLASLKVASESRTGHRRS
ncbi:hypothetical protein SO694_00070196 [Aureococcus anophagefferens]|uniref:Uncharacterized protein n=1 Tax=Aureococcus anophagefferens TaxID=44056 RepID=A0ABR1FZR4_AURAN